MHQHLIKSSETNLIVLLIQPGPGMPCDDFFLILWVDWTERILKWTIKGLKFPSPWLTKDILFCVFMYVFIYESICIFAIELKDSNSLLHGSHRLQSRVSLFGFVTYTGHCPRLNIIKADLSWQKHRVIIQRWQNNVTTGQYVSYHDKAWSSSSSDVPRSTIVEIMSDMKLPHLWDGAFQGLTPNQTGQEWRMAKIASHI